LSYLSRSPNHPRYKNGEKGFMRRATGLDRGSILEEKDKRQITEGSGKHTKGGVAGSNEMKRGMTATSR